MWFLMRPLLGGSAAFRSRLSGPRGFRDGGGGVQFGRGLRQWANHPFQSRIMCCQGRRCVEGERSNQLPQHHNKKRHLAWKYSTDAMRCELWLMKQLTAQHGVKEPGQRRERLKGWGSRLEWLREPDTHPEHNCLILERPWEEIWIISSDNQITACLFLSLPSGRSAPLHFDLPWKEELTNRQEEEGNLEMSLSPEWRKNVVLLLSQSWQKQRAFQHTLPLMLVGRDEGCVAGRTLGGRSTVAQAGVRSLVMNNGKADANCRNLWSCFCSLSRFQISGVLIRQASFQLCQLLGRCWHALNPVFIGCSSLLWQHTCIQKHVYSQHA